MIGYKLFRLRRDGTLGPLFINARQRLYIGVEYAAESHPTNGYVYRPGWHICSEPVAPHLSKRGRVWAKVEFWDWTAHQRPLNQGGLWYTANRMLILNVLDN
jgi:hypothetical protein